jgi:hypothetical protein
LSIDGLKFLHYIIQWAVDETIGQRNNLKVKLYERIFANYPSLHELLQQQPIMCLRDLTWSYASFNAWDDSVNAIRHGLGDYSTGHFVPRAFGAADEVRHGRIRALRNNLRQSQLIHLENLLTETANE